MKLSIILSTVALVLTTMAGQTVYAEDEIMLTTTPVYQLRVYEIFEHNKKAFHERFRDHAARIMQKYEFEIIYMWEARNGEKTEFVYLLRWPDENTMASHWAAFMADSEWAAIKSTTQAQHGPMVGEIQEKVLYGTNYSPG